MYTDRQTPSPEGRPERVRYEARMGGGATTLYDALYAWEDYPLIEMSARSPLTPFQAWDRFAIKRRAAPCAVIWRPFRAGSATVKFALANPIDNLKRE